MTNLLLPRIYPKRTGSGDFEAKIAENRVAGPALPSRKVQSRYLFQDSVSDSGARVFRLGARRSNGSSLKILYIHGGAYVYDFLPVQWSITRGLIDCCGAEVVMPVYPLAPEHTVEAGLFAVETAYRALVAEVGAQNIVLAGDSAGGGLALAFAHRLRAQAEAMPVALLLLFPWLDATMSEVSQPDLEKQDPILVIEHLRTAGRMWAGDAGSTDPRVSPLFADQSGLPPTLIVVGTRDLLLPDARRFAEAKHDAVLCEYPGMFHGFICAPVPEAREAFGQIATFVDRHSRASVVVTFNAKPWVVQDELAGYHWSVRNPRGSVLLQHGYGEYAGRYVSQHGGLVQRLLQLGLEVFAFDLQGHGLSHGQRGVTDIGRMIAVHVAARQSLSGKGGPLFLFGHSLGGLVTVASAVEDPQGLSGIVLSSPALPQFGRVLPQVARFVAKVAPGLGVSPLGDPGALSRRRKPVAAYVSDRHIFQRRLTARLGATALAAAAKMWPRLSDWSVPTFVMHGSADISTDPQGSMRFIREIASPDKTLKLVEDGRHELLNDIDADLTMDVLLDWIERRLPQKYECE